MIPSERLKRIQELAAETKRYEEELKDNAPPLSSAMPRLIYLRRLELAAWTMTPAELAELRKLEREIEADRDDERNGDWTR